MLIRKVNEEQSLVVYKKYGQRNVCQYDLLGFHNDTLIASLWQDQNEEWHWTIRLYNIESVADMHVYSTDITEVISYFISQVTEWLADEIVYLRNIYDDLTKEYIYVPIRIQ